MSVFTFFVGLQIGIVVGGLTFDMFVSRPTLRIVNEELKRFQNLLGQAMQALKEKDNG